MRHLVIIGGGFAGFWSAISAARRTREIRNADGLEITVISKSEYHTIRPRLYEPMLEGMRISLRNYFDPLKINLVIREVTNIDPEKRSISFTNEKDITYDCLILAAGSQLKTANFPGIKHTFNNDTFENASLLDQHLRRLSATGFFTRASRTIVIIGAGFTGIETATAMPQRIESLAKERIFFEIHLIDRSASFASNYSKEARQYILSQLKETGIQLHFNEEVEGIDVGQIILTSKKTIETNTVVLATGLEASSLSENFKVKRDKLGRIHVDNFLRLPVYGNVFAAGDIAKARVDEQHYAVMSCQHAIPQGKFAGQNAVNHMFGMNLVPYSQPRYTTCIDLGPESALFTTGWERTVQKIGSEAKMLKKEINTRWIYPDPSIEKTLQMSAPEV